MENLNLRDKLVQETLSKINITTILPNGQIKSFNEVMIDLSNIFKKLQADNKSKRKEILDKLYVLLNKM